MVEHLQDQVVELEEVVEPLLSVETGQVQD
jgi:hypothetical protein